MTEAELRRLQEVVEDAEVDKFFALEILLETARLLKENHDAHQQPDERDSVIVE